MKEILVNGVIGVIAAATTALIAYFLYRPKTEAEVRKAKAEAEFADANSYDKFAGTITTLLDDVQRLTLDNVKFERAIKDCEQREVDLKTQVSRAETSLKSEMARLKADMAALDAKVGNTETVQ